MARSLFLHCQLNAEDPTDASRALGVSRATTWKEPGSLSDPTESHLLARSICNRLGVRNNMEHAKPLRFRGRLVKAINSLRNQQLTRWVAGTLHCSPPPSNRPGLSSHAAGGCTVPANSLYPVQMPLCSGTWPLSSKHWSLFFLPRTSVWP